MRFHKFLFLVLFLALATGFGFSRGLIAAAQSGSAAGSSSGASSPLTDAMTAELNRAMTSLSKAGTANQQPPYYIGYDAHDVTRLSIVAQQGAILSSCLLYTSWGQLSELSREKPITYG